MSTRDFRETNHWSGDVVVVGAGPAGLSASRELAEAGLRVLLVDENQRPGGQIWRQHFISEGYAQNDCENESLQVDPRVTFFGGTVCHGFRSVDKLILSDRSRLIFAEASAFVIATGALERVLPVPGWTTPGVMTAGASQTYLKGSGLFPYRRVVVAGTGPLLLAAAAQLVIAGVDVAAVIEASTPRVRQAADAARLLSAPSVLWEGAHYFKTLARAGVPIRWGTGVTEIVGEGRVAGVRTSRLHRDWSFADRRTKFVDCDAVLLSHGFTSATELSMQAGAACSWDDQRQTWKPVRDVDFHTSIPNVLVVGDCGGVGGVHVAVLEGMIAGVTLAAGLTGKSIDAGRLRKYRRRLARLELFRLGMDRLFRLQPGASSWAGPETFVCRCQETTSRDIAHAYDNGITDLQGMKLWTRAGMGACQGRVCAPILAAAFAARGQSVEELATPSVRFPVRPLPVHALLACTTDDDSEGTEIWTSSAS